MFPEASLRKYWLSDIYTNGPLKEVNEKQVRPGFQIRTLELCFRTAWKEVLSIWVRRRRVSGNEWTQSERAGLCLSGPKLNQEGAGPPCSYLIIMKNVICQSHEEPLKKPGKSEAKKKRESFRARNVKKRWIDSLESLFFGGCKAVRKNKYFRDWAIRVYGGRGLTWMKREKSKGSENS